MRILAQIIIGLLVAECIYRLAGQIPYQSDDFVIEAIQPETYFVPDHYLGYINGPGKFLFLYTNGFEFDVTHDNKGRRICRPPDISISDSLPTVYLTGCSFAYGHGLPDSLSLGWQLQEKLEGFQITNLGVSGYGTVQAMLQIKSLFSNEEIPDYLVLTFAGFHLQRNTYSRKFRKILKTNGETFKGVHFPYCVWSDTSKYIISYAKYAYTSWPLARYSGLIHFFECHFNDWEIKHNKSIEATQYVLMEIHKLCLQKGTQLVVAGVTFEPETKVILDFCNDKHIPTVDISQDLTLPENTLLPMDNHPSGKANAAFAALIAKKIEALIDSSQTSEFSFNFVP